MRIQSDAGKPLGQKPSILARRHALSCPSTIEEELTWSLACSSDVIVDSLSGLLRQLKPDGTAGLSLTYRGSSSGIAVGRNVIDPKGDDVATPKLAVDRDIEQR